jgi:glyceraldehyde 3-phosphate dehydrogenase
MIKIGINGFGRIGRIALRVLLEKYSDKLLPVVINTSGSMDIEGWSQLFEYDSVYRSISKIKNQKSNISGEIGKLIINGLEIPVLAERDPGKIPWKDYGADVVLECTGVFRDKKEASAHFTGGAKKIVISAPAKGVETFVIGVNDKKYKGDLIISNASCTTNCVAPVTKVVLENFGVQKAFMTTMHAYTADQELVDGSHKDLRRARAAAVNIIPTSTGAAITTTEVLPQLRGVFDGLAYRVPVICGSVCDFTFLTTKRTTVEEINEAFIKAAGEELKGIIDVVDKPLVSSDIIGRSESAIIDLKLTQVIDGDLVKVVAWYDNEWGYCCRLVEMAIMVGSK